MKESIKSLLLLFSCVLFIFSVAYYYTRPKKEQSYQLQVYLRNAFDDSGHNALKQGMEVAAADLKVDLSFVSFEKETTDQAVEALLEKAKKQGSQGVILEPSNSFIRQIEEIKADETLPLLFVNNEQNTKHQMAQTIPVISADNQALGEALGNEIQHQNVAKKPLLIVQESAQYNENILQQKGLISQLEKARIPYEIYEQTSESLEEALPNHLRAQNYFGVVSMSRETGERLGKLKKNDIELANLALYAFGYSNTLIHSVDQGLIQGLGVSNQFAVGYAAVTHLIAKMTNQTHRQPTISSLIVTKENLFEEENQKLLFPFIQ